MTRLLDDPTIGAALQTDLGAPSHRAAYNVEAGLTRFEHRVDKRPLESAQSEPEVGVGASAVDACC